MSDETLDKPDDIEVMMTALDVEDENAVIKYAQTVRHEVTEHIKRSALAGDTKAGNLLRGLVGDMTRDIFTSRKIKVEDKNADTNAALARQVAEIMDSHNVKVSRHDVTADEAAKDDMPNFDVSEMPSMDLPAGLVSQGSPEVDIEKIISEGLSRSSGKKVDED